MRALIHRLTAPLRHYIAEIAAATVGPALEYHQHVLESQQRTIRTLARHQVFTHSEVEAVKRRLPTPDHK